MDAEMNHNSELQQITLIKHNERSSKRSSSCLVRTSHVKILCAAVPKTCQTLFTWMGSLYHLHLAWRSLMSPLPTSFTVQAQEPFSPRGGRGLLLPLCLAVFRLLFPMGHWELHRERTLLAQCRRTPEDSPVEPLPVSYRPGPSGEGKVPCTPVPDDCWC